MRGTPLDVILYEQPDPSEECDQDVHRIESLLHMPFRFNAFCILCAF